MGEGGGMESKLAEAAREPAGGSGGHCKTTEPQQANLCMVLLLA